MWPYWECFGTQHNLKGPKYANMWSMYGFSIRNRDSGLGYMMFGYLDS